MDRGIVADRRQFLRACIAGAGMVLVPKALDAFKWKGGLAVGYNDWPLSLADFQTSTTIHSLSPEAAETWAAKYEDSEWWVSQGVLDDFRAFDRIVEAQKKIQGANLLAWAQPWVRG